VLCRKSRAQRHRCAKEKNSVRYHQADKLQKQARFQPPNDTCHAASEIEYTIKSQKKRKNVARTRCNIGRCKARSSSSSSSRRPKKQQPQQCIVASCRLIIILPYAPRLLLTTCNFSPSSTSTSSSSSSASLNRPTPLLVAGPLPILP
jgi:hypothetical protein